MEATGIFRELISTTVSRRKMRAKVKKKEIKNFANSPFTYELRLIRFLSSETELIRNDHKADRETHRYAVPN